MLICFFTEDYFFNDERLKDDTPMEYMSYKEIYENSVKKGCIVINKARELVGTQSRNMKQLL